MRVSTIRVGLTNYEELYLTAETYGFQVNTSGVSLHRKQAWRLEKLADIEDAFCLRSHLGMYLSADSNGNVTCCTDVITENEMFTLMYEKMVEDTDSQVRLNGRLAFKSRATGYFLSGNHETVRCFARKPKRAEWWGMRMATHPIVNMRSILTQKFICCCNFFDPTGNLVCNGQLAWGEPTQLCLEFMAGSCYRIRSHDGRCLRYDGSLVTTNADQSEDDTLYILEIANVPPLTGLAFRDLKGRYLGLVGRDGLLMVKDDKLTKHDLFSVESAVTQVALFSYNGRIVSTRGENEITTNQEGDITDKEIFQIEFPSATSCIFRNSSNKLWCVAPTGALKTKPEMDLTCSFEYSWSRTGRLILKSSNDRYVTTRLNGSLWSSAELAGDKEQFFVRITNRRRLVLRCEFGFVALREDTRQVDCNRLAYDSIVTTATGNATADCYLSCTTGEFLSIDQSGVLVRSKSERTVFILELRGNSRLVIRTTDGLYLKGEQNGLIHCKVDDHAKATVWEY